MKKVRNLLLILIASFFLQPATGQTIFHIELDSAFALPPDSTALGSTFQIQIYLTNEGSNFNGIIDLAYTADTAGVDIGSSATSGFEYQPINTSIDSAATDTVALIAHVSQPAFKAGPSVVVIWPIATAGTLIARDSLRFNIRILEDPAGIDEADAKKLRAFILNNQLYLQKQGEIQLKRVRIYDILGKEILSLANPADRTNLPQMNTGIYLAEITYNDNKRMVFRFYNE